MTSPTPRQIRNGPFCWQNKEALRRIGEHFAESNKVPSARSVYLALCELASNEQAERFVAKVITVAKHAGVSPRTVHDVLPELALIQVVSIERRTIPGSKMDAPSVYTLLDCARQEEELRNGCAPPCSDCAAVGNNCIPLCNGPEQTFVAENLKNLENNPENKKEEQLLSSPAVRKAKKLTAFFLGSGQPATEAIYQAYPRHIAKKDALKAIQKALEAVSLRPKTDNAADWLHTRVVSYAQTRQGQDANYTPYPASWFNAGRYDDDSVDPPQPSDSAVVVEDRWN